MKKIFSTVFLMLIATVMSLTAQTKQITVVGGDNAGVYNFVDLPTSIVGATSVTLSGLDWTEDDLGDFGGVIATSSTTLDSVDMSSITFSGEFTSNYKGFFNMFNSFAELSSVVLPIAGSAENFKFYSTFAYCEKLETVANLDKFTKIADCSSTFNLCKSLDSIAFSSEIVDLEVSFNQTFNECKNLKSIKNFDKFTSATSYYMTFQGCTSLTEVRLGTDPNPISNDYTFYVANSKCIVYLPAGVTTVPTDWQSECKFAVPITDVAISEMSDMFIGDVIDLPTLTITPSYAARQNGRWEIKKVSEIDWSECLSDTELDTSYNGASLRYLVQPYELDNNNPDTVISNEVILSVDSRMITVVGGDNAGVYNFVDLPTSIVGATSVTLSGSDWTEDDLSDFGDAIESAETTIETVDMSSITLSGEFAVVTKGFGYMFYSFTELKSVVLPAAGSAEAVMFYSTFAYCEKLETVANLDKFTKIADCFSTFNFCKSLDSIAFSSEIVDLEVSFNQTFSHCKNLKSIKNFDKFTNAANYYMTFYDCSSLTEVRLGKDPNSISNDYTFYIANSECIVYLPAGVTTVPTDWQSDCKFAVPITDVAVVDKQDLYVGDNLIFADPTITPSYAVTQNGVWEVKKAGESDWTSCSVDMIVDSTYYGAQYRYSVQSCELGNDNPVFVTSNEGSINLYMATLLIANDGSDDEYVFYSEKGVESELEKYVFYRIGYTFDGWSTTVDGDVEYAEGANYTAMGNDTLYAQWTAIEFDIIYHLNGGVNSANNPEITTVELSEITLQDATRRGYTFEGWFDAETGGNKITEITADTLVYLTFDGVTEVVLYAQWSINSYDVTVSASDGGEATVNGEVSVSIEYGDSVEFVAVADDGYIFENWTNADGDVVSELETYIVAIENDLSLTANFKDASVGVDNATENNIIITTNNNTITIYGAEIGESMLVYSMTGSLIYSGVVNSATEAISVSNNGMYIVKVGDYITKTIIK